jgi:hypothetical protein
MTRFSSFPSRVRTHFPNSKQFDVFRIADALFAIHLVRYREFKFELHSFQVLLVSHNASCKACSSPLIPVCPVLRPEKGAYSQLKLASPCSDWRLAFNYRLSAKVGWPTIQLWA